MMFIAAHLRNNTDPAKVQGGIFSVGASSFQQIPVYIH